jgi:hypothetical protein
MNSWLQVLSWAFLGLAVGSGAALIYTTVTGWPTMITDRIMVSMCIMIFLFFVTGIAHYVVFQ